MKSQLQKQLIVTTRKKTNLDIKALLENVRNDEKNSFETIHLTANENILSKTAQSFLKSNLSYRYFLGALEVRRKETVNTGSFFHKGYPAVADLESAARDAAIKMFKAYDVDFRPTSGLSASLSTAMIFSNPGDTIYSIKYTFGGHFATRYFYSRMGRHQIDIAIDKDNFDFDYDAFAKQIKKNPAHLILLEPGTPLFPIDIRRIRKIVGPKTFIIYDAAHTLGLLAGGKFQDPFEEGADLIQGNTHKTFPGPNKGIIISKTKETAERVATGISSGTVSSNHLHHSIALYITVLEMAEFGKEYTDQILKNSQAIGKELHRLGFNLLNRNGTFTQSEQVLLLDENHFVNCEKLHSINISTNARDGFDRNVIRIGVQEVTRRGMKEQEMKVLANFIYRAILKHEDTNLLKHEVIAFNSQFTNVQYSFDELYGY